MANGSSFVKSGPYYRRTMENPALCSNDALDLEEVGSSLWVAVGSTKYRNSSPVRSLAVPGLP